MIPIKEDIIYISRLHISNYLTNSHFLHNYQIFNEILTYNTSYFHTQIK